MMRTIFLEPSTKRRSPVVGLVAFLVVLALAGAAVWFFVLRDKGQEKDEGPRSAQTDTDGDPDAVEADVIEETTQPDAEPEPEVAPLPTSSPASALGSPTVRSHAVTKTLVQVGVTHLEAAEFKDVSSLLKFAK